MDVVGGSAAGDGMEAAGGGAADDGAIDGGDGRTGFLEAASSKLKQLLGPPSKSRMLEQFLGPPSRSCQ